MAIDREGQLERIDYGDRVFYDSVTGIAGTTYPIGTASMPSSVIADVITLCAALNLSRIDVHGILQLLAAMEHYTFIGHCHESIADVLDLNGQDVDDSRFDNCLITGAQGGAGLVTYDACILYNMTGFRGMAKSCSLYTPLAVSVGVSDLDHCTSLHGVLTVTVGAPARLSFKEFSGGMILTAQTGGVALVRGISGYLEVDEMTGGTLDIYAHGTDIQINADCTGGTINIYGDARVTVIAGATVTVNNHTIQAEGGALALTTFTQRTHAGVTAEGTDWVDLLDMSTLTKPEEIWGITLTIAGGWAGKCQLRIVDGAGNKIFPFAAQAIEDTDFFSGVPWGFPAPVVVPATVGYKVQFASDNGADLAGKTCALTELTVVQRG